jgi:hypothetical protein
LPRQPLFAYLGICFLLNQNLNTIYDVKTRSCNILNLAGGVFHLPSPGFRKNVLTNGKNAVAYSGTEAKLRYYRNQEQK